MAISDEITRLQSAKAALKTSIEGKGVTVSSDATLDDYPALVDSIEAGGGGENVIKFIEIDLTRKGTSRSNPYIIDVTDKDVIYCLSENNDNWEHFRFNIDGILSTASNVASSRVLCWRHNGEPGMGKFPMAGTL